MSQIEPPVCVGLDVPDLASARRVVDELSGLVRLFKIGYELFYAEGPRAADMVRKAGGEVFADLKLHDIPRTVAAAVRQVSKLGVAFVNVHGLGGREMIRTAVETAGELGGPRVLTVTVLTSLTDGDLADIGIPVSCRAQALRIGRMAAEEGSDGLVLSALELDVLRSAVPALLLVTPGIRPAGAPTHDQRRSMTPHEAILGGADVIVVSRPVLDAPDRAAAASAIIDEVRLAQAQRETHRPHDVAGTTVRDVEDVEYVREEP
jgi:orotidine-5'-phosphate decarboxylase